MSGGEEHPSQGHAPDDDAGRPPDIRGHTSYAMADIFLVDRPHWATHGFKARAVLDSIRGCLLEGRFTIKGYTVEVSEALSENCCKSLNNSLHGRHARLHSFGYTACLVRAIAQASASPL